MLPVVKPDGEATGRQIMIACAVLLPVSIAPSLLGLTGHLFLAGALGLGLAYFYFGKRAAVAKTKIEARRLLQASVIYLPLLYVLMIVDRAKT